MQADSWQWINRAWIHIWQIAAIVLLVGALVALAARKHPHLAYALWLVPLVKCLLPAVPLLPVDVWSWMPVYQMRISKTAAAGSLPAPAPDMLASRSDNKISDTANPHREVAVAAEGQTAATHQLPEPAAILRLPSPSTVLILWLAGSILFAGVTWGRARERRLFLAQLGSPPDEPLERLFLRLESQLGLRRPATLLLTDCAIGPAVAGTRHPVVYFPRTLADSLPAEQLEAMLAHELIHVRRKDVWVARVQFLAQVLWWFHPAVWWMNRQIDRHRERCCDEEVLATLSSSRADYARCLVDVLTAKTAFNPLPWYPGARPVEITARRLEEIMKRANMTHRKSPAWCWYAASVLALMVLPGARPSGVTDSGAAPLADAAAPPAMLEDDQPQNPQDLAQAPDSAGADKLFDAKVDSAIGKDGAGSLPWITVDADSLLELNSADDGGPQRKAQYLELGFPATSNSGTKFTPLFALQLQAPSNGILKYDDGTADGKRSFADSGEMIRFELPDGVDKIKAIRIHGSRYGYPKPPKEDFEITFVSDDFKESLSQQTAPYSLFERGEQKWVNVKFKEPLTLPKAFWIILNFNAERTKGVYVSYDTSTKGEHSRVGLPGDTEPGKTKFEGDWMIQVVTLAAK